MNANEQTEAEKAEEFFDALRKDVGGQEVGKKK